MGIEVNACEFDCNAARTSPALDTAEGISVAAADIDDVERSDGRSRGDGTEPAQQRAISEEPAIEAREVAKAGAEPVEGAGRIYFSRRVRRDGGNRSRQTA